MPKGYRPSLVVGLTLLVALGATWTPLKQEFALWKLRQDRKAFSSYIHTHPFSRHFVEGKGMTEEELKALPKRDRPDLAAELRFLQTVDPRTGIVPVAHLFEANERVTEAKRGGHILPGATAATETYTTTAWEERGPNNVGGRTRAIMFDPNDGANAKVWAGGVAGGLWYTNDITDPAESWHAVDDFWANMAVSTIAYDPSNTQTFYVGTGEGVFNADALQGGGIFKSTDGGATWNRLPATIDPIFYHIQKIVVTGTGTVLAATRDGAGVQRSTDGGASWTSVLAFAAAGTSRAADLEIGADGRIYAAMGIFSQGSIWASDDDGATWSRLTNGLAVNGFPNTTDAGRVELAVAPSDADVLYAMVHDNTTGGTHDVLGIYRSGDRGANWTALEMPVDCAHNTGNFARGQGWYDLSLVVNPADPNEIIAGTIDLFRTSNADVAVDADLDNLMDADWTQLSVWHPFYAQGPPYCDVTTAVVHADQHGVAFRPGSNSVVFGHDGGIDLLVDASAAAPVFVNRNLNYNVTQFYSAAMSPGAGTNSMLGGTQDNGTQLFTTAGVNATTDRIGGDGAFTFIDQDNPNVAIGSYVYQNLYQSLDGGVNFSGFRAVNSGLFINPMDYDDAENILFATHNIDQILRCTNMEGVPGCAVVSVTLGGDYTTNLRTSPFSTSIFVGTSGGSIYRIDDADGTPTTTDISGSINAGYVSSIEIGEDEQQLLVTLSSYGVNSVYETLDGGTTWTSKEGDLPDVPVNWALYNPHDRNAVLLATEAGLFETVDLDAANPTWRPVLSTPTTRFDMLQHREDDTVLAASHGRGMWTATWRATPLPVELVSFDVLTDEDAVRLAWSTASETNNAGFEVEMRRSTDGAFEKVGYVEGAGTTTEVRQYSFRQTSLAPGAYAFRLKQVDYDGAFEYSPVVEVSVGVPGSHVLSAAYPNPFNPETSFSLTLGKTQQVSIEVFDLTGRRVSVLHRGELVGEQAHRFTFDAGTLSSGMYLLRVGGEQFAETRSLTLLK